MCVCGMCRIMSWLISLNNALDNVPRRAPDDFYLTLISLAPTALSLNETSQKPKEFRSRFRCVYSKLFAKGHRGVQWSKNMLDYF